MGVFETCNNPLSLTSFFYIFCIVCFITVGGLYESNVIPRNTEYEQESVWLYGLFGIIIMILGGCLTHLIAYFARKRVTSQSQNKYRELARYYWFLSHVFCYMILTLVAPGQWPFWLALGFLWEWFECYTMCFEKRGIPIGCSGIYDVVANVAGIAVAMWIHSQVKLDDLYCKNAPAEIKNVC